MSSCQLNYLTHFPKNAVSFPGFGHIHKNCRSDIRCERCGEAHSATECDKPIKCCNCGGDHLASSSACPVFRDIYTKVVVSILM